MTSRCQYSVSEHSRSTPVGLSYSIHVIIHFRSDRYILDRNQINAKKNTENYSKFSCFYSERKYSHQTEIDGEMVSFEILDSAGQVPNTCYINF